MSPIRLLRRTARSFWPSHLLRNCRWYRRWYGGRWERHWIDVCGSFIWLSMHPGRKWPEYRQPCSFGTPEIEDYPEKSI
jgi:hypothetical protein